MRPVVADVVAGEEPDAERLGARLEGREAGHEVEHLVRLEEQVRLVGRAPHGDGELHLPAVDALARDHLEDRLELGEVPAVDLRVHGDGNLLVAQVMERGEGGVEAAANAPQRVVGLAESVDRHGHRLHARFAGRACALGGEAASAGRDRAVHAVRSNGAHDVGPVVAKVSLAADERDLLHAEFGHLTHEVERLLGGELLGALPPRPRSAVTAGEIAAERDLPDGVDGARALVDGPGGVRERQVPARRRREGRDGKGPGAAGDGPHRLEVAEVHGPRSVATDAATAGRRSTARGSRASLRRRRPSPRPAPGRSACPTPAPGRIGRVRARTRRR